MARSPTPFAGFEWLIAWRYLRAKRAEGGVSVMTWISLIGITLAVFALIATLAVRSGFRAEFVDTILGANAHATIYSAGTIDAGTGRVDRTITAYEAMADRVRDVPGVTRVAPLVKAQVMANAEGRNAGVQVFGIQPEDLKAIPRIADPETGRGDLARFDEGIAIGSGVAQELGLTLGDRIRLISPDGAKTPLGTTPRINSYDVTYIFSVGRYDIDRVRVYLPFAEAQTFFNRDGRADELEVTVAEPENIDDMVMPLLRAAGERAIRIDMLERLADMLRDQDTRGGFEATADMLSITGMTLEQFAGLMDGLGYRAERGEREKVKPVDAALADVPEPEPETAPGSTPGAGAGDPPETAEDAVERIPDAGVAPLAETAPETPEVAPDIPAAPEEETPPGETPAAEAAPAEVEVFYTFTWGGNRRGQQARKPQGRKAAPKGKRGKPQGGGKDAGTGAQKGASKPAGKNKPIDPDNPFAQALAGLKTK